MEEMLEPATSLNSTSTNAARNDALAESAHPVNCMPPPRRYAVAIRNTNAHANRWQHGDTMVE
jgi:hypothetical protein